jgi:hypothetical protein
MIIFIVAIQQQHKQNNSITTHKGVGMSHDRRDCSPTGCEWFMLLWAHV